MDITNCDKECDFCRKHLIRRKLQNNWRLNFFIFFFHNTMEKSRNTMETSRNTKKLAQHYGISPICSVVAISLGCGDFIVLCTIGPP